MFILIPRPDIIDLKRPKVSYPGFKNKAMFTYSSKDAIDKKAVEKLL